MGPQCDHAARAWRPQRSRPMGRTRGAAGLPSAGFEASYPRGPPVDNGGGVGGSKGGGDGADGAEGAARAGGEGGAEGRLSSGSRGLPCASRTTPGCLGLHVASLCRCRDDACDHAGPPSEACSQYRSSRTPGAGAWCVHGVRVVHARHMHRVRVVRARCMQGVCTCMRQQPLSTGLAPPWWLDAAAARLRCAGLRPTLAPYECTPMCRCVPTPLSRASSPRRYQSANTSRRCWRCALERPDRWDVGLRVPDRWDAGALWRGTRSQGRAPRSSSRRLEGACFLSACLRAQPKLSNTARFAVLVPSGLMISNNKKKALATRRGCVSRLSPGIG